MALGAPAETPPGAESAERGQTTYGRVVCRTDDQKKRVSELGHLHRTVKRMGDRITQLQLEKSALEHQSSQRDQNWMMEACYQKCGGSFSTVARQFGKSRRQIRELTHAMAAVYLTELEATISYWELRFDSTADLVLDWDVSFRQWDEGLQQCAAPMHRLLSVSQSVAQWNCMVQRRVLRWKEQRRQPCQLRAAVPSQILVGKITADTFYDALFCKPMSRKIERFAMKLHQKSRAPFSANECDDDGKNRRLVLFVATGDLVTNHRIMMSVIICALPATHLESHCERASKPEVSSLVSCVVEMLIS